MKFSISLILVSTCLASAWTASIVPPSTSKRLTISSNVISNSNKQQRRRQSLATALSSSSSSSSSSSISSSSPQTTPLQNLLTTITTPTTTTTTKSLSAITATMLTYFLNNNLSLGPILSSSLVGLLSSLLLPLPLALSALCGTFAGMAQKTVIPSLLPGGALLGITTALTIELFDRRKWFVGVGGRLGFIAQCACTVQFLIVQMLLFSGLGLVLPSVTTLSPAAKLVGDISSSSFVVVPSLRHFIPVVTSTVIGGLAMTFYKTKLSGRVPPRLSSPVAAVSVTGLLSYYLAPFASTTWFGAGPAFCGSFVAMAAPTVLPDKKALVGACVMAAVMQHVALANVLLGGWGGKLGTAALMGVVGWMSAGRVVDVVVTMMMMTTKSRRRSSREESSDGAATEAAAWDVVDDGAAVAAVVGNVEKGLSMRRLKKRLSRLSG